MSAPDYPAYTTVTGSDGTRLALREWGRPDGPPVVFIHGFTQSHQCWQMQTDSALAQTFRLVAFDLRGHGDSDKPADRAAYQSDRLWADDVAAVVARLAPARPVLVGWSYGGAVICDYLRHYGADGVRAVNFVAASVTIDRQATFIGPVFRDNIRAMIARDVPTNVRGIVTFLRGCTAQPLPADEFAALVGSNMAVPAAVRYAMSARTVDSDDVLTALRLPVLVTFGDADRVVLPAMAEHIGRITPHARLSRYPAVGHMPFREAHQRFNAELTRLAIDN